MMSTFILKAKSEFPSDYVATVPQSEVELKLFYGSKVEKVCVVYPEVRVLPHRSPVYYNCFNKDL